MRILDQLYYGRISPSDRDVDPQSEESILLRQIISIEEEELLTLLTDQAKAVYEKLRDKRIDLTDASNRELFAKGFSLGAMITLEVMEALEKE